MQHFYDSFRQNNHFPSLFTKRSHKQKNVRFGWILTFFLFLGLVVFTGIQISRSTQSDAQFEAFTEELFRKEVASNSINLHYTLKEPGQYQISENPLTFGSFSLDSRKASKQIQKELSALQSFSYHKLSHENQLTYDILNSYLSTALTGTDYLLYDEPLCPITGIQAQLPVLLSEYQFYKPSDVSDYLHLLSSIGSYFDSLGKFERARAQEGLFMSDDLADAIIQECYSFIAMGEKNYLYSSFLEKLNQVEGLTAKEYEQYKKHNETCIREDVFPAYQTLARTLTDLKQEHAGTSGGLCRLPNGLSYYKYLVKLKTGSFRSLEKLEQLTLQQIQRDLTTVSSILSDSSQMTSASSFSDSSMATPETMLDSLKTKISESFPEPPNVQTTIKYVPSSMQDYLSPAFYMIPAIDDHKNNTIYINPKSTFEPVTLFTTLAHEGYPGHLYQTTYFSASNPPAIRQILDFGGYVEGWATYTEMMSYYLSPLSNREASCLQANQSAMLGLYALADIRIHSKGWTFSDMKSFFGQYGITDEAALKEIFQLIVSDPANYLQYYIGYLEFLELKKAAIETWGDDFSQKHFHKAVLDVGPAPFPILKEYVLTKPSS